MNSNPTVEVPSTADGGSSVSLAAIRALPKVSLHDHLDGGLRAATLLELAAEIGHELPASTPDGLADWIYAAASSGSLERYLETFAHTVAVLQTPANLRRVAREYVADLAADGVVYGETRWAPEQHLAAGMTLSATVEAVRDGLAEGMAAAAASGQQIEVRQLLTAMRHVAQPSVEIAALAVSYRDQGVVGFDIAGAEAGFPPSRFHESFEYLRRNNFRFTIHAGEAAGPESIAEAVQICGANRIGHGVRLVEDISLGTVEDIAVGAVDARASGAAGEPRLGDLAAYVRDQRIPLELCASSNVQTGAARSIAEHPIDLLRRLRFRVTVNTDNRLMSRTTLTREFAVLAEAFGWGLDDIRALTINAAKSAFLPFDQRVRLIEDVIKPAFVSCR